VKVLAIVQVRLGSTRFPRKALADLYGRPLIAHVVERVRRIHGVGEAVLAVPPADAKVFAALHLGLPLYAPEVDERDVLARFVAVAALHRDADTIMRITGDCPLLNPAEAERVLVAYQRSGLAYAWNVAPGYVDGDDCEVFSRQALLDAHWNATEPRHREHVTSWIRENRAVTTVHPKIQRNLKTSIDTPEELERVRELLQPLV
jgi:spore coat polysaccharide biosynthesis protein SpsF (cytidylyltransferase family)